MNSYCLNLNCYINILYCSILLIQWCYVDYLCLYFAFERDTGKYKLKIVALCIISINYNYIIINLYILSYLYIILTLFLLFFKKLFFKNKIKILNFKWNEKILLLNNPGQIVLTFCWSCCCKISKIILNML